MNLSVEFLGKVFENPFVLASGPATANGDMICRALEKGWAGAVTKTLIKEPVTNLKNRFACIRHANDIVGFENIELLSERSPDVWFSDIASIKKQFPEKIVIGSIMGDARTDRDWIDLAVGCTQAGCDFIELNYSCPHGYPETGKGSAIGQNAEYAARITRWLADEKSLHLPLIPKLTAAVADISHIGQAVADAGAAGLCAINTFPSIMGFDLRTLSPVPSVSGYSTAGGYSGMGLKPIALRCVNDLVKHPGLPVMGCGGVSSGYDAAEFILSGSPVLQACTAVMLKGYGVLRGMIDELTEFMGRHEFPAIDDFLALGNRRIQPLSELDTGYGAKAVWNRQKCRGCMACFVACRDAASQAITSTKDGITIDPSRCSGCSLCSHVCPNGAVEMVVL